METRLDNLKQTLRQLGHDPKENHDEGWMSFDFRDLTFRCTVDEAMDFMAIGLAYYQEHGHVSRDRILELINIMNEDMAYVKVIEINDFFWITYELPIVRRMPDMEEVKSMIKTLTDAYCQLVGLYKVAVKYHGRAMTRVNITNN